MAFSTDIVKEADILHFLKVAYFGDCSDVISASVDRAFRDMCRTIQCEEYKDLPRTRKKAYRKNVTDFLKDRIKKGLLPVIEAESQQAYDAWHKATCDGIINEFSPCFRLHYGQAQKWLNMTIKYLCVFKVTIVEDCLLRHGVNGPMMIIKIIKRRCERVLQII